MRIIQTADWKPTEPFETYQVYNGLDCCLTFEIFEELPPAPEPSYSFVRAMQAPALEMMLRGIAVDLPVRDAAVAFLERECEALQLLLDELATAIWDRGLNPASSKQKLDFLYGEMKLPVQTKLNKSTGERRPSADRNSLEKLTPLLSFPPDHRDHSRTSGQTQTN